MKPTLSLGVCILISLALVAFGLFYGITAGFSEDRAYVSGLLSGEDGLLNVLHYRGADGLNLCVVARRHLTGDADVAALETAAKTLRDSSASLTVKRQEDARLTAAAELVATKLRSSHSFSQSHRDKAYLDMLLTDMQQLSQSAASQAYNDAVHDFNNQLDAPIIGALAKFLGVKPCELYQ